MIDPVTPTRPAYLDAQPATADASPAPPSKPDRRPATAAVVQLPGTTAAPPAPPVKVARKILDVERIGKDYRADQLTVREIGARHGCSGARVTQLAKEHGWKRDIRAKARARAEQLLAAPEGKTGLTPAPAEPEVEALAGSLAFVRKQHRASIDRARRLVDRLMEEVIQHTDRDDVGQLLEKARQKLRMHEPDAATAVSSLRELTEKVTSLPGRVNVLRQLGESLKTLIALERQAFGLDDAPDNPKPPADMSLSAAETYRWLTSQRPS